MYVPSEVVEEVMEEDHGNDTLSERHFACLQVLRRECDPDGESTDHAAGGDEEELPPSKAVDHHRPEPGLEHVAHKDEAVELILVV